MWCRQWWGAGEYVSGYEEIIFFPNMLKKWDEERVVFGYQSRDLGLKDPLAFLRFFNQVKTVV